MTLTKEQLAELRCELNQAYQDLEDARDDVNDLEAHVIDQGYTIDQVLFGDENGVLPTWPEAK